MTDRPCSRCSGPIGKRWEDVWPTYCKIEIGCAAQIFNAIGAPGSIGCSAWKILQSHPAFEKCTAQSATIHWHNESYPPESWAGKKSSTVGGVSGKIDGQEPSEHYSVSWATHDRAVKNGEFRESPYKLCRSCHMEFLAMLGEFLIGEDAQLANKKADQDSFREFVERNGQP